MRRLTIFEIAIMNILSSHAMPVNYDELRSRFWQDMGTQSVGTSTWGDSITQLYIDGLVCKQEGRPGYYLSKKGQKVLHNQLTTLSGIN